MFSRYVDGTKSTSHAVTNNVSILTINATKELDGKNVTCRATYTENTEEVVIEAQAVLYSKSEFQLY